MIRVRGAGSLAEIAEHLQFFSARLCVAANLLLQKLPAARDLIQNLCSLRMHCDIGQFLFDGLLFRRRSRCAPSLMQLFTFCPLVREISGILVAGICAESRARDGQEPCDQMCFHFHHTKAGREIFQETCPLRWRPRMISTFPITCR